MSWMLYGVTGYTGLLILEEALKRGEKPVIAGRNKESLIKLSAQYGVQHRCFSLEDPKAILKGIEGMKAVLHCAGPFSKTSEPMLDACLDSHAHYLDITGEIEVFERIFERKQEAQERNCIVIPGVGFDVLPSDCLAALLKKKMPDATHLELAFHGWGKLSPGTTKTIIENLSRGSRIRKDGNIIDIPALSLSQEAHFSDKTKRVHVAAWGDVSTAYYSTHIPNIIVYAEAPELLVKGRLILERVAKVSEIGLVQKLLNRAVDKYIKGPTPEEQKKGKVHLWGRVKNAKGETQEGTLDVCEAYHFTALTAVTAVQRILNLSIPGGCYTPSLAFGPEIISSFPEASLRL